MVKTYLVTAYSLSPLWRLMAVNVPIQPRRRRSLPIFHVTNRGLKHAITSLTISPCFAKLNSFHSALIFGHMTMSVHISSKLTMGTYRYMIHNAIPWESLNPRGSGINIKIVGNTPGYPIELNRHNALTFSQCAAPGHPGILIPAHYSRGLSSTSPCKQWIKPAIEVLDQRLSCR